jgi:hypothetical protein
MKNKYFGYEFRPAVALFTHKICLALALPQVSIEWSDRTQTAAINARGKILLANVRDDAILTRKDLAKYVGFVVHELLHRKYTNFNVRGANQYIDELHNAIEDAWIESLAIKSNLTGNIAELLGALIDDMTTQALDHVVNDRTGEKIDWSDPAQYPFVLAVHARPHATLKVPMAQGLEPIFEEAVRRTQYCNSSFDTLEVAVWVYERLNLLGQEPPPPPPVNPQPPRGKPSDEPPTEGGDIGTPCDDGEPTEEEGGNGNGEGEDGQGDDNDKGQGDKGKGDAEGEGDKGDGDGGSGKGEDEPQGDEQGQGQGGVARPPVRSTATPVEPRNEAPRGTESTGTYSATFRLARDAYHVGDTKRFELRG